MSAPAIAGIRKKAAAATLTRGPGRLTLTSDRADSPLSAMRLAPRAGELEREVTSSRPPGGWFHRHPGRRSRCTGLQRTTARRATQARPLLVGWAVPTATIYASAAELARVPTDLAKASHRIHSGGIGLLA